MKYLEQFPLFSTKNDNVSRVFELNTREGRKAYFEAKAGDKIKNIKAYLKDNTFIAFLLAKKSAGKGTYTKLMMEIFGDDLIGHISVGDVVRSTHNEIRDHKKRNQLKKYLEKNYRGFISIDEALDALEEKTQEKLLPTEFILSLVKREIERQESKVLFIDGFPRGIDQIPYTLFFKELIDLRDDPDFFVTIDVPESVIEERMKTRVVCPICQSPRSTKLFPTEFIGFDESTKDYFLMCDNPQCNKERMVKKEGDLDGINQIKNRLKKDGEIMDQVLFLHGISKILLRSSLPVHLSKKYCDSYELTKEFYYTKENDEIMRHTKDFVINDDEGDSVVSLVGPAVILQFIDQLSEKLINKRT